MRQCTWCGEYKPLSEFRFKRSENRYCARCKVCSQATDAMRRGKRPMPDRKVITERQCVKCRNVKPLREFPRTQAGQYRQICGTCAYPIDARSERQCVKCGLIKPANEFSRNRHGRTLKSWCKACNRASMQIWHEAHPYIPKPHSSKPPVTEKVCSSCGIMKPIADFYPRRNDYMSKCKPCSLAYSAAYFSANPHKRASYQSIRNARQKNAPRVENILRTTVIARDNGRCYLCGAHPTGRNLTLDHVIPLSRGGSHTMDNLRVACASCNSSKGAKLLDEMAG